MPKPCENKPYGCPHELGDKARNTKCQNCRTYDKKWKERKGSEVIARYKQVTLCTHRLEPLLPEKVVSLVKHRRRA